MSNINYSNSESIRNGWTRCMPGDFFGNTVL